MSSFLLTFNRFCLYCADFFSTGSTLISSKIFSLLFLRTVLRKMDHGENCIMMNFTACILHRILLGGLNQGG
jgi:hypothetical protein